MSAQDLNPALRSAARSCVYIDIGPHEFVFDQASVSGVESILQLDAQSSISTYSAPDGSAIPVLALDSGLRLADDMPASAKFFVIFGHLAEPFGLACDYVSTLAAAQLTEWPLPPAMHSAGSPALALTQRSGREGYGMFTDPGKILAWAGAADSVTDDAATEASDV